jgi:hypothetical protein
MEVAQMTQTVAPLWDVTPAVSPLASGILDHASVKEGITWSNPRSIGLSYNCLDTAVPTELCPEPTTAKEFGSPGATEGIQFAVYGGVTCKPFGFDEETGLSEIERVFGLKESRGVERALMETRFVAGPDDDPGAGVDNRWDPALDLTPAGGAVSPKIALAILEGYAASIYAGVPTLHIPYTIGSLLASEQHIEAQGGKWYSRLGSKAAVGAGYEFPNNGPDGTNPTPGELWVYASGEVMVARSAVESKAVTDFSSNDIYALAERRYLAAVDCFTAAVRVSVE